MPIQTLFEKRLERELTENADSMFKVELGDSHRHAFVKGVRQGLEKARDLYRQVNQIEDDEAA